MEEYEDKILICVDCNGEFVFTSGEQLFFADKGLKNDPKRCKQCKQRKNERIAANVQSFGPGFGRERVEVVPAHVAHRRFLPAMTSGPRHRGGPIRSRRS